MKWPPCQQRGWVIPSALGYLAAPSLYLLRETLLQWYAKAEGWNDPWGFGWRCEGSSRPECSPSHRVSHLTWPVRPSTDQAFIPPSPGAWTPNKATIWSPWISKSFSFWFPLSLASVFPLCSGRRVGFLLSVMDCLVNLVVCKCALACRQKVWLIHELNKILWRKYNTGDNCCLHGHRTSLFDHLVQ